MNKKRFQEIRFYLFTSSYSCKLISKYIKNRKTKKETEYAIKRLSEILDLDSKALQKLMLNNDNVKSPYKNLPEKIKIYLEIEKELINLSEEKSDEYSTIFEDYGSQLLSPAIERAAGNLVGDVKNDLTFSKKINELIPKYNYMYYRTAFKYKLPTMRIVPFVIRLIS
ncbi:hypothetical protein C4564_02475 [Candidatus Microgenomates bacterium]|nr:MAG: hypothetical protein C4564_02475 [Candidatus Microgenomates bacterium]